MSIGTIFLVRHGLTDWSTQQLRLGSSDIPLNEEGEKQAHQIAKALKWCEVDEIWHTDLLRTQQTADAIAEIFPDALRKGDARFRERDHGVFEGTVRETVNGADTTSELSPEDAEKYKVEPIPHHWERITAAYPELRAASVGKTVVLVSHYGTIRMLLAHILGLDSEGRRKVEAECASISIIRLTGSLDQITLLNSTAHLDKEK